jgi:serine/threonine protein kinase
MDMTTTLESLNPTITLEGKQLPSKPNELIANYHSLLAEGRFSWTAHHRFIRPLGRGGQGVVYLTERRGSDGFTLPIALKVFSPQPYEDARSYELDMSRIAIVASRVARIQQDNLLNVHNFYDRGHIRMMPMEWIDGSDIRSLLSNELLNRLQDRVSATRWEHVNEVILTEGEVQPIVMPGVAVQIVRDCLAALAALHRDDIVHGDIKPANIMLKRTGTAKIIDIGSAFDLRDPPPLRSCTPRYAAPELLDGGTSTPRSDLASLGYVLIELLSGKPIFSETSDCAELLESKRSLAQRLDEVLPESVTCNELLMKFCQRLIAPDPARRFATAEHADYVEVGASAFHRQLVKSDLASEYENEIRLWLDDVKEIEDIDLQKRNDPTQRQ